MVYSHSVYLDKYSTYTLQVPNLQQKIYYMHKCMMFDFTKLTLLVVNYSENDLHLWNIFNKRYSIN